MKNIASLGPGRMSAAAADASAPRPGTTRIAVLSDAHVGGQGRATWHGPLEYRRAVELLAAAVDAGTRARADLLISLGDHADRGDESSLHTVLAVLSSFPGPVRVVPGNHDRTQGDHVFEKVVGCGSTDVLIAGSEVETHTGFGLCGVDVTSSDGGVTCLGRVPRVTSMAHGLLVLASHYPVLDVTARLTSAGIRDAGMLRNRDEVAAALSYRAAPTLVLNGHLHARVEHAEGAVLQLSVAALIEAPHELTLVDIAPLDDDSGSDLRVRRMSVSSEVDPDGPGPVLAGLTSHWRTTQGGWARQPDVTPGLFDDEPSP